MDLSRVPAAQGNGTKLSCSSQQQQQSHLVKHHADAAGLFQPQGGEHGGCQTHCTNVRHNVPMSDTATAAASAHGPNSAAAARKQPVLAKQDQLKQQESRNPWQQQGQQDAQQAGCTAVFVSAKLCRRATTVRTTPSVRTFDNKRNATTQ